MSVTRLKRKHRKNIARANNKQNIIKNLLRTPVLKNVDIEELKSRFGTTVPAKKDETSILETVKNAASAAVDKVKEVADAVSHSSVVEKAKEAVADAVEAVSHSEVVEKASHAISDAVDKVKEVVAGDKTAANATAFDDAEAVTKPVNEDGQEGEHPKPEIAL
jgi:phenylalanyl-tRNA synthetase alpha subunit